MKRGTKVLLFFAGVIALAVVVTIVFGNSPKNSSFQPQEEFKLTPWVAIKLGSVDLSINRAVLYLFLASGLTCFTIIYVARRMQARPNKIQALAEMAYDDLARKNITRTNLPDPSLAAKWFAFIATRRFPECCPRRSVNV